MTQNNFGDLSQLETSPDDVSAYCEDAGQEQHSPIPKPDASLLPRTFDEILRDPSLAKLMHPPDYFLLVE
jgi:hypothetical protein